ncbi:ankyrin repeat-containing domain protein [Podospora didyma]|uniref:Ankyrin repeat-containing domain protein n=1 Tax=Podospora didyma TaxID=330526 RepID=A0AAE0NSC0_9PEZI|nr:ankyrin repeat-containing domain protein [Podospora didyma]
MAKIYFLNHAHHPVPSSPECCVYYPIHNPGYASDPNFKWNNIRKQYQTPLSYVAEREDYQVVGVLLDYGVNVGIPDGCGRQPLSYAAEKGHSIVIDLLLNKGGVVSKGLLKRGASPNPLSMELDNMRDRYFDRGPPLLGTLRAGNTKLVKLLLNYRAPRNPTEEREGSSVLCDATAKGCKYILPLILDNPMVDPNHRTNLGHTRLTLAASRGHEEIVQILLATPGINAESYRQGRSNTAVICYASTTQPL